MIDQSGNNLVFLLSTPRAGSTLLSVMLGRHSQIHCPNEPWFLLPLLNMHEEQTAVVTPYDQRVANLAVKELLPNGEFYDAARAFALSIYNGQLAKAGKSVFVDKTPRYYHILGAIDKVFPSAKRIWLKRNPLDVAASFVSTWNMPLPELIGERITPSSFDVTLSMLNLMRYFRGQPGTYEIAYEELVEEPARHLEKLCIFLGLKPEPDLDDYAANEQHLESLRRTSMGDKKVFGHSKPHRQSVDQWKKVLNKEEVQLLLDILGRATFERMGYGGTVKFLKGAGYRFPSDQEVEARLNQLQERAKAFPFSSAGEVAAVDDAQKFMKKLRRHWWIRLGRRLGISRLSSM